MFEMVWTSYSFILHLIDWIMKLVDFGHRAPCKYGDVVYMMLFGLVHVIMSFILDLYNMAWVSIFGAIMSFTYSSIGLGLGITTIIGKVHFHNWNLGFVYLSIQAFWSLKQHDEGEKTSTIIIKPKCSCWKHIKCQNIWIVEFASSKK